MCFVFLRTHFILHMPKLHRYSYFFEGIKRPYCMSLYSVMSPSPLSGRFLFSCFLVWFLHFTPVSLPDTHKSLVMSFLRVVPHAMQGWGRVEWGLMGGVEASMLEIWSCTTEILSLFLLALKGTPLNGPFRVVLMSEQGIKCDYS